MNPFLHQSLTQMLPPWWDLELTGCCMICIRALSDFVMIKRYVVGSFVGLLKIEFVDYVLDNLE